MKKNDFDYDDVVQMDSPKTVFIKDRLARDITINITGPIEEPGRYLKELDILRNATEEDQILMVLCTPGGWMNTASLFLNAMLECRAPILCEIDDVASAGTMIALGATAWKLTPRSIFMVHNCSYGTYGKDSDVHDQVVFSRQHHAKVMKEIYTGFLSDDEIQKLLGGKEYYFSADELKVRLKAYAAYRRKKLGAPPLDEDSEFEVMTNDLVSTEQSTEEYEDVELDENDPSTWPDGTEFRAKKAVSGLRKGQRATILRTHETEMGYVIEFMGDVWGMILPSQYESIEYVGSVE